MSIILRRESKEYALHPDGGPYPAILSEIRSHEGVEMAYGTKDRLQLIFQTSELARKHEEGVLDDRPMTVSVFVNSTLNDNGRLMTYIAQQVPPAHLNDLLAAGDVDIEELLVGTQWMLSIEHNVAGYMKAPEAQQIAIWEDPGL